ncbi:MAG: redoxin domain-containing protein [Candidatus Magnetominusculus sp. LBB02]|nr:redoxin domain-containing protein [Candidatus Magnetominusculus sp. LBB02]
MDVDVLRSKRVLLISAIVFTIILTAQPAGASDLVGQPAPDFTLQSTDGSDVALSSYKGKVILLNFWATWCTPCRDEMPSMNKLYMKYKDKGLVIIAVSTDDSIKAVERFLSTCHVDFPVLIDHGMKVSKRQYRINAQPATFLIGKDGKVINRYFGGINWLDDTIQKEIAALLPGL